MHVSIYFSMHTQLFFMDQRPGECVCVGGGAGEVAWWFRELERPGRDGGSHLADKLAEHLPPVHRPARRQQQLLRLPLSPPPPVTPPVAAIGIPLLAVAPTSMQGVVPPTRTPTSCLLPLQGRRRGPFSPSPAGSHLAHHIGAAAMPTAMQLRGDVSRRRPRLATTCRCPDTPARHALATRARNGRRGIAPLPSPRL